MTSTRFALYAATATAALWAAKGLAIGLAGGLGESPWEGPLFFAGLVACLVTCGALGASLASGLPPWLRAVVACVAPVVGVAFAAAVDSIVGAFVADGEARHWAWTEVNLWTTSVVALLLALALNRRASVGHAEVDSLAASAA